MTDYLKHSDREIDILIRVALGFKKSSLATAPKYSTSWEHAGPLFEILKNTNAILQCEGDSKWRCGAFGSYTSGGYYYSNGCESPTRAICEAFLKWKALEKGGRDDS